MRDSFVRRTASLCWWRRIRNRCWRGSRSGSRRGILKDGWIERRDKESRDKKRRDDTLDYVVGICRGNADHVFVCSAGAQSLAEQALRRFVSGHAAGVRHRRAVVADLWAAAVGVANYLGQCDHLGADRRAAVFEGEI